MTEPFTAGEPLVPPPEPKRPEPRRPEPKPPKAGRAGRNDPARPARRRRSPLVAVIRGLFGLIFGLATLGIILGAAGAWVAYQHFSENLPDLDRVRQYQPPVMSRVYAGDARLLSELATERRIFVPIAAIPPIVGQAFISAEDQSFRGHHGVDPLAIARAAMFNVAHMGQGRRPIGASTITQQVAKNMLLDGEVSIARKVREAILAVRIEDVLSKDRILELYLNEIYLGLGSYGVAAAAQTYFNKSLDELTIQEAAFLAALPKAPNNYNPFRFPEAARARRDWVIDRMAEDHAITAEQAAAAKASPIAPSEFRRPPPIPGADWFTEEVRRELIARFGADATTQGGLVVRTSLDPVLQLAAEKAVREGLMAYDRKKGGWRGAVTRLEAPASFARDWPAALASVARPPGMLPAWKLAVVISATDTEARLGWLEPAASSATMPLPRTGVLALSEIGWARPVNDGKLGAPPRRMSDVALVGDVLMVEPFGSDPLPPKAKAPAGTVTLRQIPQVQGALVSLEPATGRVLAMVGGWSFEQSQFNRATQAQRQPGSSFKPMVYLTALEHGVSPSQRFLDAPIVVDTAAGRWRPGNYEGTFSGPVPLRVALEESLNLVTLRVAQHVGMQAVADTAIAFHMNDGMPRVLPAALGAVDTTVIREAGAYGAIASGGREVIPSLIDSVQDREGTIVFRGSALACPDCGNPTASPATPPAVTDPRAQLADPASVFQLITMMQGVVRRGTGFAAGKGINRPIGGKTGTTQDFTDAWFSGFTADLATAVWVGFDNPASLGEKETGGALAAPIWHDYMAVALEGRPVLNFPMPPGVTMATWGTGLTDAFKPDQVPGASNSLYGGFGGAEGAGAGAGSESGTPSGGATAAGQNPAAVHGGVDTNMGGLY